MNEKQPGWEGLMNEDAKNRILLLYKTKVHIQFKEALYAAGFGAITTGALLTQEWLTAVLGAMLVGMGWDEVQKRVRKEKLRETGLDLYVMGKPKVEKLLWKETGQGK
jgi:hypothetical protein